MTKMILGSLVFCATLAWGQEVLPTPSTPPVPQPPTLPLTGETPKPAEIVPKPEDFTLPTVQSGVPKVEGEIVNPSLSNRPSETTPLGTATGTDGVVVDTFTRAKAEHFSGIFNEMKRRGFQDGFGHTVAAAKLADCLPGLSAGEKVDELIAAVRALGQSRHAVISQRFRNGGVAQDSAISALAATLVCKKGTRTAQEMVIRVEVAYQQLFDENWLSLDAIHNVAVAANLLN